VEITGARASSLPELLTLERLDRDLFRARNADLGARTTLYGGQVAAQALLAAAATVEAGRVPHSFHGYFLRPGLPDLPVILQVDRDRDGRSFSARHVVAVQEGAVIFSMLASFHAERPGATFDEAPRRDAPPPESTRKGGWNDLVDVREVTPTDFAKHKFTDCIWVRSSVALSDDPIVQRAALAYMSDLGSGFGQVDKSTLGFPGPSIDHAMWFHEPIRADDWVLLDLRPIKAGTGRSTYQGSIRDEAGRLGATLAQETLLLPMSSVEERLAAAIADEDNLA
jgi:acyl-CoA thioesterase-2